MNANLNGKKHELKYLYCLSCATVCLHNKESVKLIFGFKNFQKLGLNNQLNQLLTLLCFVFLAPSSFSHRLNPNCSMAADEEKKRDFI